MFTVPSKFLSGADLPLPMLPGTLQRPLPPPPLPSFEAVIANRAPAVWRGRAAPPVGAGSTAGWPPRHLRQARNVCEHMFICIIKSHQVVAKLIKKHLRRFCWDGCAWGERRYGCTLHNLAPQIRGRVTSCTTTGYVQDHAASCVTHTASVWRGSAQQAYGSILLQRVYKESIYTSWYSFLEVAYLIENMCWSIIYNFYISSI
jgi:hypothetical protein